MALKYLLGAIKKALICLLLTTALSNCQPNKKTQYDWQLPQGFPAPLIPTDNPMTEGKVALGRQLFFDTGLSFNNTMSCATCHQPQYAFAEPSKTAIGSTGSVHRRNTQSLVNIAYNSNLTWAHSGLNRLEQQILIPMFSEDPIELGITGYEKTVLERFQNKDYHGLFMQAFGEEEATFDYIVKALASYVRSLTSFDSPFDQYAYQAKDDAISDSAKRGMELFFSERFECFHCHGGFNFTQSSQHQNQRLDLRPFHNTGLYNVDGNGSYPSNDKGLIEITLEEKDMGKYRAPTLRNVAVSAPYMHDGSLETLSDVIDFYAAGGRESGRTNPLKSPFIRGFDMRENDKQDIIAFLHSLTDPSFLTKEAANSR